VCASDARSVCNSQVLVINIFNICKRICLIITTSNRQNESLVFYVTEFHAKWPVVRHVLCVLHCWTATHKSVFLNVMAVTTISMSVCLSVCLSVKICEVICCVAAPGGKQRLIVSTPVHFCFRYAERGEEQLVSNGRTGDKSHLPTCWASGCHLCRHN